MSKARPLVLALLMASTAGGLAWVKVIQPMWFSKPASTASKSKKSKSGRKAKSSEPADEAPDAPSDPTKSLASTTMPVPPKSKESAPAPAPPVDPKTLGIRGYIFAGLDANHDRQLTTAELPDAYRAPLQNADANKDGQLSFSEFDAAVSKLPPTREQALATPATPPAVVLLAPPPPGERVPVYEPFKTATAGPLPDWFRQQDADGDQQLGVYEWRLRPLDQFERADRNRDGFITPDEAIEAKF